MVLKSFHKIVALFLSIYFPACFLCQPDDNYWNCGQPFQCANITQITYPFWDMNADASDYNNKTLLCGRRPGFGLDCGAAVPILFIAPLYYQVLAIDYTSYTLTVARQDLWNNACHPILADSTFVSSTLFTIPLEDNYTNLTLYYNCTGNKNNSPPNYSFTCGGPGTTSVIFRAGNASTDHFTCKQRITVPVNETAARALESSTLSPTNALASGFRIRWSANNVACANCTRLLGVCAYDRTRGFYCDIPIAAKGRKIDRGGNATPPAAPAPIDGSPARPPAANNGTNLPPKISSISEVKDKASYRTRLILGVAFGGIGFILVFIVISWLCKRQYCSSGPTNPNIEKFILQQESLATKRYRYSEIKKMTKSFSDKLGQGGYGSVYKGMLPDGSPVAVKLLFEIDSNDDEFINEVASIGRTSHVNIVSLLGFCYERNKRALVYEFMPNKSLDKFIRDADTSQDVEKLFSISIAVAKGLEYLHTGCNSRIIHFDIKPQNILLDENFCPKISDFGLAKLCKKKQSILSVEGLRGTTGYIAPEVFSRNFGGVSHKSDVYSYGIMLLEMAGANKFVETESSQSGENYFPDKIYEHVIAGHVKNVDYDVSMVKQEDDERTKKMFLVGFWCMQTMPSERPSISKVVEMLEGNLEWIPIPPKPFLCNPERKGQGFSSLIPIYS